MEPWRNELYSDELCHHGILGQKWGRRRFQNEDGSLTPEGRERYGVGENEEGPNGTTDQSNRIRPNESYNKELDRISLDAQYESMMQDDYMQEQIEEQKRRTRNIIIGVGAAVAVTAGGIIIAKKFKEAKDERNALAEKLSEVENNSATKDSIKDFIKKSDADKAYAKTGDLKDFLKKADADKAYAKTGDLKDFLKSDSLKGYAKTSDLKGFAKSSDLKGFAKTSDFKDVLKNNVKKSGSQKPSSTLGDMLEKLTDRRASAALTKENRSRYKADILGAAKAPGKDIDTRMSEASAAVSRYKEVKKQIKKLLG